MPWPKHLSCPVEAVAMTPNTSAPAKVNGERQPQPLYSWTVLHTPLLTLINTSMSHHNPPRESVGPHVKPADSRASGALVAQKLVMCSLEFFYSYWWLMLGSADSRPDKGNSSKSPSRLGYKENGDFVHLAWFIKSLVAFHHISIILSHTHHELGRTAFSVTRHKAFSSPHPKDGAHKKLISATKNEETYETYWNFPCKTSCRTSMNSSLASLTLQPALPARKSTVPLCRRHSGWQGGAPDHKKIFTRESEKMQG